MADELRLSDLELGASDDEWGVLAVAAGNVFGTPEWMGTWWRHFGDGRRLLLSACRDPAGRLVAVLPLYEWRSRPVRVVRFLGHGPGDALAPVCAASDRAQVATTLRRQLDELDAAILVGDTVPGEEGWSGLLGARVLSREASPVLSVNGADWEELLASWSRNLRSQVRSRERKLLDREHARFRLADDAGQLDRDLDLLFALHRQRWPEGSGFGKAEAFHREFARLAFDRGWARLWFLEVDGQARAAWYGFRFANVESYYQAGRDAAWDRHSVGFVLLAHSIREAVGDGVREYRFLRGDEDFKFRFASHDHGLETLALARGALGRAALGVALRLPRPLLRRLSGG